MKISTGSIDVTKIDKERIYKGKKGKYLSITIRLNDEPDQYDQNGMITQSISREEKESGMQGAILGNVKIVFDTDKHKVEQEQPKEFDDDLPF